jgi:hypothetical protein
MRQYDSLLILTDEERDQLERWARSRSLPSATVFTRHWDNFLDCRPPSQNAASASR